MATQRIPSKPGQFSVQEGEEARSSRRLNRALACVSPAEVIIAAGVILTICYVAKIVFIILLVSILLAFVLEPVVDRLERLRLPRTIGSVLAILLLLGATYGISYFFYNRALGFAEELPKYSQNIRGMLVHVVRQKNELQTAGEKVLPPDQKGKQAVPVTVVSSQTGMITRGLGTVTEVAFTIAFIPFLVYFMLSWREHARRQTAQLFPPESRSAVYATMGQISEMLRSFITGNFVIGLCMGVCSLVVFAFLGLPYFYFLGFISGFVSLVPYLGIILALIPPLTAGIGRLNATGLLIVVFTVAALHVFSMNVLYPKVLGKHLQLNPLVVTVGLLIWGFIWGAMGLILAIPLLGAIKIICDHVPRLRAIGAWMED